MENKELLQEMVMCSIRVRNRQSILLVKLNLDMQQMFCEIAFKYIHIVLLECFSQTTNLVSESDHVDSVDQFFIPLLQQLSV